MVEDIADTGYSLEAVLSILQERNPESIKVAAFLSKEDARMVEVPIDFLGFRIPKEWVVGYGLDSDELYRELPFIGILHVPTPSE